MFETSELLKEWNDVLDHKDCAPITSPYRKAVTARLLENTAKEMEKKGRIDNFITENNQTTSAVQNYDPVLISLVRRNTPNLIAFDLASVQPMSMPTGLIFAMKARYNGKGTDAVSTGDTEALYNEADTAFSGLDSGSATKSSNPFAGDSGDVDSVDDYAPGTAMSTALGETLGKAGNEFSDMGFTIEKSTVTAETRGLKAEYTEEIAQDLKAVHGLDAHTELVNILSTEMLAEQNREIVRLINLKAVLGAAGTTTPGTFDLSADADGRWAVEKFKSLLFQLELEANAIAKGTRRGKGNNLLCSSNVASALAAAGVLDYAPALSTNLNVDDTGNTFAGLINGRMKVFIDPYATVDYATLVYRGSTPYDAGIFYCPYIPMWMVEARDEKTFQPKVGFKTRYGIQQNPFVGLTAGPGANRSNPYFRIFAIGNINVA